jgi:ubiquinone/menaquinone biosynthesis C-methylase UbiE
LRKKKNIFLLCFAFSGMMTISMVQKLIVGVMGKKCPNAIWEWWYFFISKVCDDDITMMNYGFDREGMALDLPQTAAGEQFCYQLYHYTATGGMTLSLDGLEVLEVGCGRGGGAFYMATRLGAKGVVGCDISDVHQAFCKRVHGDVPNLRFQKGDAERLPFGDEAFDVVVNVESLHCYANVDAFLSEVQRVLVRGGHFLVADIVIPLVGDDEIHRKIEQSGFEILAREDISSDVLKGLDGLHDSRLPLIEKHVPSLLVPVVANFAAIKGSKSYNHLKSGRGHYFLYVLRRLN